MRLQAMGWVGLVCVGSPLSALAQSTTAGDAPTQQLALEEVIVTAERRTGDVQKIATSVSVRSGAALIEEGKYSLQNILEDIPGITGGAAEALGGSSTSGTDALAAGLTIRGIQSNSGPGGSVTSVASAAAIYVDGVYEGVGAGYDIDRIEVLRGPQGTLYGRSATSGVVAIHTRNPELSEFGGNVTLEAGDYSLQHYAAALNVPLSDTVALRVAGNRYERDGYDSAEGGARSNTDAKVKLLYQPSDAFSVLFGFALQDNETNTGGVFINLTAPDTLSFAPGPVGPGENKYRQYWAEVNWDLGAAKLTYLPALRTWESEAVNFVRTPPISNFNQSLRTPDDKFWTHELRLASDADSDLTWQVGALYYNNKLEDGSTNTQFGDQFDISTGTLLLDGQVLLDRDSKRETTAAGVFAETTYSFATDWRVTAGLRYDYTEVKSAQDYTTSSGQTLSLSEEAGTRDFENLTYKARLEHDLTPENLLYGSISTGFSPGDVTITEGANGSPTVIELKDQTLTAFEVGTKNRFLVDTLQLNGSVYYYDYGGYQTASICTNCATNPATPTFATLTSPLEVYGAELELLYRFTPADRLGFNLAYTNAHYVDKDSVPLADGSSFADYFGRNKVAGVAPVTADLSYEHVFTLPGSSNLSVRGDVRYLSEHDAGRIRPDQIAAGFLPYVQVEDQYVGNLSVTWSSGRYSLTGYVRNIADERYKTGVSLLAPGAFTTSLTDPRTWGVVLNAVF